jgi:GNAT superfamily N-acetyltransferase
VIVRPRTDDDVDACVRMATLIRDLDGYPTRRPLDLREFLAAPDALGAWVAEREGQVVGHVALHRHSTPEVLAMASHALNRPADQLGVVARLLVSPETRREKVGRTLLTTASTAAVSRGLWPILDVVTTFDAAVNLYENCGWVRVGQVTFRFHDGGSVEEFVYRGPHGARS